MTKRGLLLTMTEPPAAMEEEFNAWYDSEHIPERLSIAGFRSARRWSADTAPGEGKYLATYELDSPQVLMTPEYLARLEGATPACSLGQQPQAALVLLKGAVERDVRIVEGVG